MDEACAGNAFNDGVRHVLETCIDLHWTIWPAWHEGFIRLCTRHVLDMRWPCIEYAVGRALDLALACVRHVLDVRQAMGMSWACVGHALAMQ